jgi:hypothetical protein
MPVAQHPLQRQQRTRNDVGAVLPVQPDIRVCISIVMMGRAASLRLNALRVFVIN